MSEFEEGELVKGELIHKKTGLPPEMMNEAIKGLSKSLIVDIPDALKRLPPYDFYAS